MCEVIFLKDSNSGGENMWVISKIGEVDELSVGCISWVTYIIHDLHMYSKLIIFQINSSDLVSLTAKDSS